MKKTIQQDEIDSKVQIGQLLYEKLLTEVHNNNLDEMYKHFSNNFENLEYYGDTKEKQLLNYCTYKTDLVEFLYSPKKKKGR